MSYLDGFDREAALAEIADRGGRAFWRTLYRCPECGQWRVEPMNALQHHLLDTCPASQKCHHCRSLMQRNDFQIFFEEFTPGSLTSDIRWDAYRYMVPKGGAE